MSSVTFELEVLAVLVLLLVMAVACCCVAFCVFQIMQQEFQRHERMIMVGALQTQHEDSSAGNTSIQMIYDPEEYQNAQMMQNNNNQLNYQAPGTTITERTTITTTVTNTPATQPTRTAPTQTTRVYTGTATQRIAGAKKLGFTATDETQKQASQSSNQATTKSNSDLSTVSNQSNIDPQEKQSVDCDSKRNHKTFVDLGNQKEFSQVAQVAQEPQERKEALKKEDNQLTSIRRFRPGVRPKPYTHIPAWVLDDPDMNIDKNKLIKFGFTETMNKEDSPDDSYTLNSDDEMAWKFMIRKQMGFIGAQQKNPFVGFKKSDEIDELDQSDESDGPDAWDALEDDSDESDVQDHDSLMAKKNN